MKYSSLLSKGKIGSVELRNRLVMPAMSETLTDKHGSYTDDEMAYYSERAKGGTGLIITSFGCVDPRGLGAANQLCAYDRESIVSLKKISEGVHRNNGKIFLQLHHAGRAADPEITGVQPMGPSAIPTALEFGGFLPTPREMTREDIQDIIRKFIFAAGIGQQSNFDGVEVHCAHSYLLNQFISPMSNHRTDEYGGSTENRAKIVVEIITGIKAKLGRAFPVSVRLETEEGRPEGLHIEEAVKIACLLEKAGADMINVSAGGYETERLCIASAGSQPEGYLVENAAKIKAVVNIPVAVVGLIRDFGMADSIIAQGKADFIVMGRPHIADPYMINKLMSNREREIRPCINCLHCTDSAAVGRMECAVNPTVGFEKDFQSFYRNGAGRKIVVAGGGPGGCEAARVLAIRGFNVTLLEKSDRLGGQVNYAAAPPHKEKMLGLFEYYKYNLARLGVDIRYDTVADADTVAAFSPAAAFVSTGSDPVVPPVEGIHSGNVYTAQQVLGGAVKPRGKDIAVIGSGGTGIETAEFLLDGGNRITLIDMLPRIGALAGGSDTYVLMDIMNRIKTLPGMKLAAVDGETLKLTNAETGKETALHADYVVLALGLRRNDALVGELREKGITAVPIANAFKVGDISYSVKHAFYNAFYFDGCPEEMV